MTIDDLHSELMRALNAASKGVAPAVPTKQQLIDAVRGGPPCAADSVCNLPPPPRSPCPFSVISCSSLV